MLFRWLFWPVVVAATLWGVVRGMDASAAEPRAVAGSLTTKPLQVGVGGCAAAACHGSAISKSRPSWTSSHSVWIERDPHARAYAVLFDKRSDAMYDALVAANGEDSLNNARRASEAQLCRDCHTSSFQQPLVDKSHLGDGVGCESCHGSAEKWKSVHHLPSWKGMSAAQKSALGFVDLRNDLRTRAESCVGCHVGEPTREVHHDLIAAGHPPLRFEFSSFHNELPKHWGHGNRSYLENNPTFTASAWLMGQEVASTASLKLLAARADGAEKSGRWPEFAEYNCFSCHTDLRRKTQAETSISRGELRWGTFYHWLRTPTDVRSPDELAAAGGLAGVASLMGRMDEAGAIQAPSLLVALQPRQLGTEGLRPFHDRVRRGPDGMLSGGHDVAGLFDALLDATRDVNKVSAFETWEGTAQWYLAVTAILESQRAGRAFRTPGDAIVDERLRDLWRTMAFGREKDSPESFSPAEARRLANEILKTLMAP